MKKGRYIFIAALMICSVAQARVLVNGVTEDCFAGKRTRPAEIDVYIFDASKSLELRSLLQATDSGPNPDDPASVERFTASYDRVMRLVKTSNHLAHTKSIEGGIFKAEIAGSVDHLLVVAYAESVDGPGIYTYFEVRVDHQTRVSMVLDFARGHCPPGVEENRNRNGRK